MQGNEKSNAIGKFLLGVGVCVGYGSWVKRRWSRPRRPEPGFRVMEIHFMPISIYEPTPRNPRPTNKNVLERRKKKEYSLRNFFRVLHIWKLNK